MLKDWGSRYCAISKAKFRETGEVNLCNWGSLYWSLHINAISGEVDVVIFETIAKRTGRVILLILTTSENLPNTAEKMIRILFRLHVLLRDIS